MTEPKEWPRSVGQRQNAMPRLTSPRLGHHHIVVAAVYTVVWPPLPLALSLLVPLPPLCCYCCRHCRATAAVAVSVGITVVLVVVPPTLRGLELVCGTSTQDPRGEKTRKITYI